MASRGKVKAFSARDGKEVWTFGRAYGEADLRDVAAYITDVWAK